MKKKDKKTFFQNIKDADNLTEIAKKMLNIVTDNQDIKSNIELINSKFSEIINENIDISKGISGGNILDFAQNARLSSSKKEKIHPKETQDLRKILSTNTNEIYTYFQDVYQNKFIEIADLKFIAKFIPALGAAVKCQLDAICNADDMTGTIARTIQIEQSIPSEIQSQLISTIHNIEKEYNLQKRLKNNVIRTALVSGKYYVYAIAYADLFEQYSKERAESANAMNITKRNFGKKAYEGVEKIDSNGTVWYSNGKTMSLSDYDIAIENITSSIDLNDLDIVIENSKYDYITGGESISDKRNIENSISSFGKELKDRISDVKIIHSSIPEDILENMKAFESYNEFIALEKVNDPNYKGLFDSYFGKMPIDMEFGTVTDTKNTNSVFKAEKKFNVTGTYIRYIDPKNIIPVKLMGETIGYLLISSRERIKRVNASTSNTNTNILGTDAFSGAFNIGSLNDKRKNNIIDSIVNGISQSICQNFNKKFVSKNIEFKKAIADCITYNGFLDNEYHVQFIESKYITEFTINEDEEGNGESILANSLFPAKLLLSLIVARMLNYLNHSGSSQVAHIAKGPIDTNTSRQTQRIIRNIQESKITFSDLLSTNLVFNKFQRNKNVLLPKSKDGTNLVEFEIMDGQSIEMDPEYENKLEQMAILGTGTPSVIMEYLGQTDFAKGFETGNIQYAIGISGKQADLEVPITKLYNILVQNSNLDESIKTQVVNHFTIKLNRPKVLTISNNNEYLSTLQQLMQMISTIMFGENNSDEKSQIVKDLFTKKVASEYAPYIDWERMEVWKKESEIEASDPKKHTNQSSEMDMDMSSGGGDNSEGFEDF